MILCGYAVGTVVTFLHFIAHSHEQKSYSALGLLGHFLLATISLMWPLYWGLTIRGMIFSDEKEGEE